MSYFRTSSIKWKRQRICFPSGNFSLHLYLTRNESIGRKNTNQSCIPSKDYRTSTRKNSRFKSKSNSIKKVWKIKTACKNNKLSNKFLALLSKIQKRSRLWIFDRVDLPLLYIESTFSSKKFELFINLQLLGYGKIIYGKWRCNVCTVELKGPNKRGKYAALKQFELHYEAVHKDLPLCINFCLKLLSVVNFSFEIPIWNWPRCRAQSEREFMSSKLAIIRLHFFISLHRFRRRRRSDRR